MDHLTSVRDRDSCSSLSFTPVPASKSTVVQKVVQNTQNSQLRKNVNLYRTDIGCDGEAGCFTWYFLRFSGARDSPSDWDQQKQFDNQKEQVRVRCTLGPAYKFSYNEHPAITSIFLLVVSRTQF